MIPLTGHISDDTAYVVNDYPYGFRLRCKIRYWIESHPKKGFRFCSQTTNPKITTREYWNSPKKSTYSYVCEGLFLDENNHVKSCALSEYSSLEASVAFLGKYANCLNPDALESLKMWIKAKELYQQAVNEGVIKAPEWKITPSEPILISSLIPK